MSDQEGPNGDDGMTGDASWFSSGHVSDESAQQMRDAAEPQGPDDGGWDDEMEEALDELHAASQGHADLSSLLEDDEAAEVVDELRDVLGEVKDYQSQRVMERAAEWEAANPQIANNPEVKALLVGAVAEWVEENGEEILHSPHLLDLLNHLYDNHPDVVAARIVGTQTSFP